MNFPVRAGKRRLGGLIYARIEVEGYSTGFRHHDAEIDIGERHHAIDVAFVRGVADVPGLIKNGTKNQWFGGRNGFLAPRVRCIRKADKRARKGDRKKGSNHRRTGGAVIL